MLNAITITRNAGLLLVLSLSAACGGGGSGSSGTAGTGNSGGNPASGTTFTPPVINYSGLATAALISENSAPYLAQAAWFAVGTTDSLSQGLNEIAIVAGAATSTETCTNGGSVSIQRFPQGNGTGYFILDQNQCTEGDDRWSGRLIVEVITPSSFAQPALARIHFYGLLFEHTYDLGNGITVTGTVSRSVTNQQVGQIPEWQIIGDLLFTQQSTGAQRRYSNIDMQWTAGTVQAPPTITASGRVYESNRGYVDVSTLQPVLVASEELVNDAGAIYPHGGGPIRLMGAASLSAFLGPLSSTFASVGVDLTGNGSLEKSRVVRWNSTFLTGARPGLSPEAIIVASYPSSAGTVLDGRHSDGGDTRYVSGQWSVLASPAGSHPILAQPNQLSARLTTDVPGDYTMKLEVSDGTRSARDFLKIHIDQQALNTAPYPYPASYGVLGPDLKVQSGGTLQFNTERSVIGTGAPSQWRWEGFDPSVWSGPNPAISSSLTLVAPPSGATELKLASASYPSYVGTRYLIVAPALRMLREHSHLLPDIDLNPVAAMDTADLNGDGREDIVAGRSTFSIESLATSFDVLENTGSANFTLRHVASPSFSAIRVFPYNSDARPDLYLVTPMGMTVMTQGTDGSFTVTTSANRVSSCVSAFYFYTHPVEVIDIDGDGLNDVVTVSPCQGQLEVYRRQSNGSFVFNDPGIEAFFFTALDVNGDSCGDVATSGPGNAYTELHIYRSQCNGSFMGTQDFPGTLCCEGFAKGDLNHDGVTDFAMRSNGMAYAFIVHPGSVMTRSLLPIAPTNLGGIAIADMDGDARNDVWAGNEVLLQTASGFSSVSTRIFTSVYSTVGKSKVVDINGDQLADLVGTGSNEPFGVSLQARWDDP